MRDVGSILSFALMASAAMCAAAQPADVCVVVPAGPRAKAVDVAAAEFAKYHELATGRRPGVGEKPLPGSVEVRIGIPMPGMDFDGARDSYRIRSFPGGVALAGGNPRSTLYAVYDFLERRGGCRWFWDGDVVPKRDAFDFSGLDVYEVSRFDYRAIQYFAHRGLVRFEAEGWGLDDWKREIDWCAKTRLNFFMMQIGMDDIFQKAFPGVVPYPDPAKTAWCDSSYGFDRRSPFWSLQFRGRLRKAVLDYARERGMMHPAKFGTQTHWFSRTPKEFLDGMKPDFLVQATRSYSEKSGLVWDVRKEKWREAYWRLTEAEIENYGCDDLLFTPGFDERMCSTNRAENLALKKKYNMMFIDEAYRRHPSAKVLIEGWDLHVGWLPDEIRSFFAELDPKRTVIWDYSGDATRLSGNLPIAAQKTPNDITRWGVGKGFPYVFGIMLAYDHATDVRANYPLIRSRFARAVADESCKGVAFWPETSHSDAFALRFVAENFWRPSAKTTAESLDDFCHDRYGEQAEAFRRIWADAIEIGRLADWRRILPVELNDVSCYWNEPDDMPQTVARANFGDFEKGVPPALRKAPDVLKALAAIDWMGDFVRRDAVDLARTVADRALVRGGRELVRLYRRRAAGDETATGELKRRAAIYLKMGHAFADLLALHSDFSLSESLERMDAVEKIANPEFEKVFFQNTGGSWYCRSHQYEFASHPYLVQMEQLVRLLVDRAEAGDFSPLPRKIGADPFAKMAEEAHPITSRRPTRARTAANWRTTCEELSALSSSLLGL